MNRRRAQVPRAKPELVEAAGAPVKSLVERQRETAEYLADMVLELRNLARSVQLFTVMVPLEYAYYEAFGVANRVEVPPEEVDRIKRLAQAGESLDRDPGNGGI